MAPSTLLPTSSGDNDEKFANINWDELGFGLTTTDYMYIMKSSNGDKFSKGKLIPYGNIEISPSSVVLNYGQGLFEGMKAYRKKDGEILLFRPDQNAQRMQMGAERMCLLAPTTEEFIEAVKQTVLANKRWVPPHGRGSLYLRPLLIGTSPSLGSSPSSECTFLVYAAPVGNFFKAAIYPQFNGWKACSYIHNAQFSIDLFIDHRYHRAAPGGTGGVKSITNYSPVFEAVKQAKANGFHDVLFLDAATGKCVEEVSTCNIFILKDNVISTPSLQGTILSGITRKSIMELAVDHGYKVEESLVPLGDVLAADEVFCTGTAVVITPVGSITYEGRRVQYKTGEGSVSSKLLTALTGIQTGLIEDKKAWTIQID